MSIRQKGCATVFLASLGLIFATQGDALSKVREYLDVEISATPAGDRCALELAATNSGTRPITLKFNTAQRYDFYAKDSNERIIWRWSDKKVFANVQGVVTLQRGESIRHKVQWKYVKNDGRRVKGGRYQVMGAITARPQNRYSKPLPIEVPDSSGVHVALEGQVSDMGERVYLLADDGIAYRIENPNSLRQYNGRRIHVDDASIDPIPGSVDRKITIRSYRLSESKSSR